jgi:endonuclease YncB( thermonuclease family)
MTRVLRWLPALLALMPVAGLADEIPACAGPVEIEGTVVSRIEQNGVLITTDGIAIRMEGIRLPSARADRAPGQFTDQAYGLAQQLTRSHSVTLTAIEPKQDRYDRVRAQAFVQSADNRIWVQKRLLEQGLARVALAPDRVECASELFAAEASARAARRGIWSSPNYAIRAADALRGDIGTFQIVEGKVTSVVMNGGRAFLNFGVDWHTSVSAVISNDDLLNFDRSGVDPHGYEGKTIRVRGIVQQQNGPTIEVANPQGVEVVDP